MRILKLSPLGRNSKYCTSSKAGTNTKYTKTVLLPRTKFPLRLDNQKMIERDTFVNNLNKTLYAWQLENLKGPRFILHDGPPYANGVPHMGHAINKILKDTILRTKMLEGQRVNYIPGWDCHGLPIELKAVTNTKKQLTPMEIRQKARNFANQTIEKQKAAFQSWGVLGDWENSYKTFTKEYTRNQMLQFYTLYEKNLIYRDVKPVYWSPSSRTALAEAELEYNAEHKSTAATVRFRTVQLPDVLQKYERAFILIWTTTPWTLPSNQAVCYNENLLYCALQEKGSSDVYIMAKNLVEAHSKLLNKEFVVLDIFKGSVLREVKYLHPIYNTELSLLSSDHATDIKGTGLVHAAPAHGPDDFLVALRHNIIVKCLVDEEGKYTEEAGKNLEGLSVLNDGTKKILEMLQNDVVHIEDFVHSYPYDWRTKQPVILRASKQWFIDTNAIKDRATELLDHVQIIPKINRDMYKKNLVGQLRKRPFWCISRQRKWGSPIPVFYEKSTGKHIINRDIIDHLCNLLEAHGTDYWWKLPVKDLLPENILKTLNLSIEDVDKGEDILDIWFDSGVSWSSVLDGDQIADMYLEGTDQFTGWFQSSLTTSVAIRDKIPYKSIYVHGFALDEKGLKMSKSLGNVIDPQEVVYGKKGQKPYGIDTLRWWVACHANQDAVAHISRNVLEASADEVQKVRGVLRFALGALDDYEDQQIDYDSLHLIDKYLLHMLYTFNEQAKNYSKEYQFHKMCSTIINLTANQISALYYTSIKDRLYCDAVNSTERRSAQFVLYQIFNVLSSILAPIVPHLVEELHHHVPYKKCESFFEREHQELPRNWCNVDVENAMEVVINIKRDIDKVCGSNPADQIVDVTLSKDYFTAYKGDLCAEFCHIFQVAKTNVSINNSQKEQHKIVVSRTENHRCDRCRKYSAAAENQLCVRCQDILEIPVNKGVLVN